VQIQRGISVLRLCSVSSVSLPAILKTILESHTWSSSSSATIHQRNDSAKFSWCLKAIDERDRRPATEPVNKAIIRSFVNTYEQISKCWGRSRSMVTKQKKGCDGQTGRGPTTRFDSLPLSFFLFPTQRRARQRRRSSMAAANRWKKTFTLWRLESSKEVLVRLPATVYNTHSHVKTSAQLTREKTTTTRADSSGAYVR
jgi:hypothetical protein